MKGWYYEKSLAEILEATKGSIIVSCQALPDEPMYCEEMSLMPYFANAAKQAGSKCIRTSSIRDVVKIKKATGLPVIGLVKRVVDGYASYITPTMQEVGELVAADSDIIALDCTQRERGDDTTINEFIAQIKEKQPLPILQNVLLVPVILSSVWPMNLINQILLSAKKHI